MLTYSILILYITASKSDSLYIFMLKNLIFLCFTLLVYTASAQTKIAAKMLQNTLDKLFLVDDILFLSNNFPIFFTDDFSRKIFTSNYIAFSY